METLTLSTSLRTVVAALHKGLRKQMYSANTFSMTEMETISQLLRNTALLPTELAALARIKTQSMSQVLKKLEEQDLIIRTPSTDDKRKVYISLSESGKKMIAKVRYDGDEWLKDAIEKSLSKEEKELIAKVIPVLNKIIGQK